MAQGENKFALQNANYISALWLVLVGANIVSHRQSSIRRIRWPGVTNDVFHEDESSRSHFTQIQSLIDGSGVDRTRCQSRNLVQMD